MTSKIGWAAFAALALAMAVIQFIPAEPVVIPAQVPVQQRPEHRLLVFEGISNFRDLGGYPTADGRRVKWGALYRSANLAHATDSDLVSLQQLGLSLLVDLRSRTEREQEPNRLPEPAGFKVVRIPVMDGGDQSVAGEIRARLASDELADFDPNEFMLAAYRRFADQFTPEFSQYLHALLAADGKPVLWHCSAGKDRTGFATAILLRILGVAPQTIMEDYMLSKAEALASRQTDLWLLRLFKGEAAYEKLRIIIGVEEPWLQAGLDEIDARWGGFDNYVSAGLKLSPADLLQLRDTLLE